MLHDSAEGQAEPFGKGSGALKCDDIAMHPGSLEFRRKRLWYCKLFNLVVTF